MDERRKFPRVEIDVLVNYDINAKARSKDISENGICLITGKALEVGSFLNIVFSIEKDDEIKAIGKVKWTREVSAKQYENGLEFWHIDKIDENKIKKYVEH